MSELGSERVTVQVQLVQRVSARLKVRWSMLHILAALPSEWSK